MATWQEFEAALSQTRRFRPETEAEMQKTQVFIDWLENIIVSGTLNARLTSRSIRRLRELCRVSNLLPTSFNVFDQLPLLLDPISKSTTADVYRIEIENRLVAVKVLRLHQDDRENVMKVFRDEAIVWRCLRHENVTRFLGVASEVQPALISEWMSEETISVYLKHHPSSDRLVMIGQILRGLTYLHSLDIVHGDLKSPNILVNLVDEHPRVFLADFGISTILNNTSTNYQTTGPSAGTTRWMAPELMLSDDEQSPDGGSTKESDIYAIAIVFWELYSGTYPFSNLKKDYAVVLKVTGGERPPRPTLPSLTDAVWLWITSAWAADPKARPSLESFFERCMDSKVASIYRILPEGPEDPSSVVSHEEIPVPWA